MKTTTMTLTRKRQTVFPLEWCRRVGLEHGGPLNVFDLGEKGLLIGPVKPDQYEYLRSVTFYVTPDQLSVLSAGAIYYSHPDDVTPLIARFGSVDNVLAHAGELTGRIKESLEANRETALLSKRLATLNCETPCPFTFDALKLRPPHEDQVKSLLIEFEFNSIGRRLFGDDFKAGRGFAELAPTTPPGAPVK